MNAILLKLPTIFKSFYFYLPSNVALNPMLVVFMSLRNSTSKLFLFTNKVVPDKIEPFNF